MSCPHGTDDLGYCEPCAEEGHDSPVEQALDAIKDRLDKYLALSTATEAVRLDIAALYEMAIAGARTRALLPRMQARLDKGLREIVTRR